MIEVVCAVIQDGQGRFLACQRPRGKHLAGLWEFPGGKVDPDETQEDALKREMREELGVEVEVGASLDAVSWSHENGSILLRPFFCAIKGGTLQTLEHEALIWLAPEDFETLRWAEADVPILEQIRAIIPAAWD